MARTRIDNPLAAQIAAQIAELERQYERQSMPQEAKEAWDRLNDRLDELEVRDERLREPVDAGAVTVRRTFSGGELREYGKTARSRRRVPYANAPLTPSRLFRRGWTPRSSSRC